MPLRERLKFLQRSNYYNDYSGFIYALQEYVIDPATGARSAVRVKYGITNNIDRKQKQYTKCGDIEWLYYWPTDCVRITGIGGLVDIREVVEEVYLDTAQAIMKRDFKA
ncbi:hypothetical protein B0H14DRAFT_2573910 [Mycena olivaceomarginata]|nr:hypothetical protein B0H14DRAFT_2573910 [Mycena olivaceomarginata]